MSDDTHYSNPHIITPEEAKNMVCPQNRMLCDADKCMAWRWASVPDDIDESNPNGWVYSTTHGYCGKAPL